MKVLLATDGSSHATEAARFLSRLPHREPLELTIASSVHYPNLHPADAIAYWPPELWQRLRESAAAAIESAAALFEGADVVIDRQLLEDHPGESIISRAREGEVELIVMGARGHSTVDRILLGSVSDYVAQHADCGVLVVRPSTVAADASSLNTMIAYDGSPRSDVAVDQFARFKWGKTTRANVLTVVPIIRFFGRDVMPEHLLRREEQRQIADAAVARAAKRLAPSGAEVHTEVVESEHIGAQIVASAKHHDSGLVVLGATGFGPISRILLGSVPQYVLRHAACSVWIAR